MPGATEPTQTRAVTWLGHSTCLIEVGGARLLTDPVLRPRVAHLRRHAPPLDVPGDIDAVLISHLHHDHADLPTLRRLPRSTPVLAPPGAARLLRGRGDVHEVRAGDRVDAGGQEVLVTPAEHPVQRMPWGAVSPALGFVAGGIYFAGDTDRFEAMAELAPLEVALLPVWGWGPRLGPGHLDPEEAAETLPLLRPKVAIPIHWGSYLPLGGTRRHGHLLTAPGPQFAEHARRIAPEVDVRLLAPGETWAA